MTIEATEQIVKIDGRGARVWTGKTERGIAVQVLVTRIAVAVADEQEQFQRELLEVPPIEAPEESAFFNLRTIS